VTALHGHPHARRRVEADAARSAASLPDSIVAVLGAMPEETLRRVFRACLSVAATALREGIVPSTHAPIVEVPVVRLSSPD
jgi:hypothetical protein